MQHQKTRQNFLLLMFIFSQIAKKNLNKIHGLQEIHLHQNYDFIFIIYSRNYSSLKSQRKNSLTIKYYKQKLIRLIFRLEFDK